MPTARLIEIHERKDKIQYFDFETEEGIISVRTQWVVTVEDEDKIVAYDFSKKLPNDLQDEIMTTIKSQFAESDKQTKQYRGLEVKHVSDNTIVLAHPCVGYSVFEVTDKDGPLEINKILTKNAEAFSKKHSCYPTELYVTRAMHMRFFMGGKYEL